MNSQELPQPYFDIMMYAAMAKTLLKEKVLSTRERACAITKLDEAQMWARRAYELGCQADRTLRETGTQKPSGY